TLVEFGRVLFRSGSAAARSWSSTTSSPPRRWTSPSAADRGDRSWSCGFSYVTVRESRSVLSGSGEGVRPLIPAGLRAWSCGFSYVTAKSAAGAGRARGGLRGRRARTGQSGALQGKAGARPGAGPPAGRQGAGSGLAARTDVRPGGGRRDAGRGRARRGGGPARHASEVRLGAAPGDRQVRRRRRLDRASAFDGSGHAGGGERRAGQPGGGEDAREGDHEAAGQRRGDLQDPPAPFGLSHRGR